LGVRLLQVQQRCHCALEVTSSRPVGADVIAIASAVDSPPVVVL